MLTWDDAPVAVLALVTQLLPSIAGVAERGGQFLHRRKRSSALVWGGEGECGEAECLTHTRRGWGWGWMDGAARWERTPNTDLVLAQTPCLVPVD